ncbi:MAG: hypothetical protein ACKPKO_16645, partial [Candidatus Fonsibacter sp.]
AAFVDNFLGHLTRPCFSQPGEAMHLDLPRSNLQNEARVLAGFTHFGLQSWLGSFSSHLLSEISITKTAIAQAIIICWMCDETSLPLHGMV